VPAALGLPSEAPVEHTLHALPNFDGHESLVGRSSPHGCYLTFQMAEVAIPRNLFAELRPPPLASTA
jgi:hypothetical protein